MVSNGVAVCASSARYRAQRHHRSCRKRKRAQELLQDKKEVLWRTVHHVSGDHQRYAGAADLDRAHRQSHRKAHAHRQTRERAAGRRRAGGAEAAHHVPQQRIERLGAGGAARRARRGTWPGLLRRLVCLRRAIHQVQAVAGFDAHLGERLAVQQHTAAVDEALPRWRQACQRLKQSFQCLDAGL